MPTRLVDPAFRVIPVLALILAAGVPACASLKGSDVPACQGPRRPANPHGSVLAEAPAPQAPAAAPAGACGASIR